MTSEAQMFDRSRNNALMFDAFSFPSTPITPSTLKFRAPVVLGVAGVVRSA